MMMPNDACALTALSGVMPLLPSKWPASPFCESRPRSSASRESNRARVAPGVSDLGHFSRQWTQDLSSFRAVSKNRFNLVATWHSDEATTASRVWQKPRTDQPADLDTAHLPRTEPLTQPWTQPLLQRRTVSADAIERSTSGLHGGNHSSASAARPTCNPHVVNSQAPLKVRNISWIPSSTINCQPLSIPTILASHISHLITNNLEN